MILLHLLTSLAFAAEEEVQGFTIIEIWQHSGWLARGVIVLLAFMALGTLFLLVERLLAFGRARRRSILVAGAVAEAFQNNEPAAALEVSSREEFKSSYLAGLLKAGLAELVERPDKHGVENAERAVDKAIGEEVGKLRRGMVVLATVGSTAPFVGLFGTTFGVINAFDGMAKGGGGSGLASVSAGISEALITTGVGIGVAVLGVWVFNYFNARIDKVNEDLRTSEQDFMVWAEKLVQPELAAKASK